VYFLEVKAASALTTLPPFCAVVMKSGNLKFLEPSGSLQACNGTALALLQAMSIRRQIFDSRREVALNTIKSLQFISLFFRN
jgi:hypothetical protein